MHKIRLLEDSLRTNIAMARAMAQAMQFTLARRYIEEAKKDKNKLAELKKQWDSDLTKSISVENLYAIRSVK